MAMAHNQAPTFFFAAALLLLAAAAPPARAQLLSPVGEVRMNVIGLLTCPGPGGGRPISNVNVTLLCATTGVFSGTTNVVLGRATTGADGQYTISPSLPQLFAASGTTVNGIITGEVPCVTATPLPVNPILCASLSAVNGTLIGILPPAGSILSGNLLNVPVNINVPVPINLG